MNDALAADYLFVGEAIRARLQEQIAELAPPGSVLPVEAWEDALTSIQADAPAVLVGWDGDTIPDSDDLRARGGKSTLARQAWRVDLVVRDATQQQGDWRDAAIGPLLSKVHRALAGFVAPGAYKPLLRVQARRAQYGPNTAVYPMAFAVELSL